MDGSGCMLRLAGDTSMVSDPVDFGGCPIVRCSFGHIPLASFFISSALESGTPGHPRRRGTVGEGIYHRCVAELDRLDDILPMDDEVHDGLQLIDGQDIRGGFVVLRCYGNVKDSAADQGGA